MLITDTSIRVRGLSGWVGMLRITRLLLESSRVGRDVEHAIALRPAKSNRAHQCIWPKVKGLCGQSKIGACWEGGSTADFRVGLRQARQRISGPRQVARVCLRARNCPCVCFAACRGSSAGGIGWQMDSIGGEASVCPASQQSLRPCASVALGKLRSAATHTWFPFNYCTQIPGARTPDPKGKKTAPRCGRTVHSRALIVPLPPDQPPRLAPASHRY